MDFEISALDAPLGAEVRGWDPSAPLGRGDVEVLRDALNRFVVLLFRGQRIPDDDELVRFSESFGDLHRGAELAAQGNENPYVLRIENDPEQQAAAVAGATILPWHSDYSYQVRPAKETFLAARVLPDSGGDTSFCDMYRAWDALGSTRRRQLGERNAWHRLETYRVAREAEQAEAEGLAGPDHERRRELKTPSLDNEAWHPVAAVHPEFGKTALYLDMFVYQIEGMSPQESQQLRDELIAAATTADNVYRHEWHVGDLVVFDQVGAVHRRDPFDTSQARVMRQLSTVLPSLGEGGDVAGEAEHDSAG